MRTLTAAVVVGLLLAGVASDPAIAQSQPPSANAAADPEALRAQLERLAKDRVATPEGLRVLGEMYAAGDGGVRDKDKAVRLWKQAAEAGDRHAPVLIGDYYFSKMTGGRLPVANGSLQIRGSIPLDTLREAGRWYEAAVDRDDRPDAQMRATVGLTTIKALLAVEAEVRKAGQ